MATSASAKPSLPVAESAGSGARIGLTNCGNCESGNPSDRRFCGECGDPLWVNCPDCGVECGSGESFCGGCGINLRDVLKSQIDVAEAALAKASTCAARNDLNDAIRTLRSVRLADHRALSALSDRIAAELARLKELAEQQTQNVDAGLAKIRELIAACAFKDALTLLQTFLAEFRTKESDRLLAEANSKLREIVTLKAEIREAVEKKQLLDLAPKIQRLLMLQPDADGIRRLAGQVRDRLLVAAKKKLHAYEFKQARELVSRVPECAMDDNSKQMSEVIAEFNWLANDLQLAPVVVTPLVEIAKRFAKKAPGDQQNVERCSKIFRLVAEPQPARSKRFPAVEWTPPPRRTPLGCAIDWLGGSERLKLADDTVAASWEAEPGCFFVAAGLALQGVSAATVNTNLLKGEKQGLLGQLSIGRRKETIKRAWGIDIGESSLKVVRLVVSPGDPEPSIDCCELLPHQLPLNRPEAEANRHRLLAESLRAFLAKYPLEKADRICVSFASQKVLARPLRLPESTPKKRDEMVQYEAKQRIPVPLDELAWNYHSFTTPTVADESAHPGNMPNTLLIAAKQREVHELELLFREVEIPLHVVQSDAIALFNLAAYEGLGDLGSDQTSASQPIALLDVGTIATNIVVIVGGQPWFRSFRRGGEDFTSAAAQRLHLTNEQAEQAKLEPTRVRRLSELYEAFDPMFARMTEEVQRSLESFNKETSLQVSRILGVGGGFRLHGLLKYLRNGP